MGSWKLQLWAIPLLTKLWLARCLILWYIYVWYVIYDVTTRCFFFVSFTVGVMSTKNLTSTRNFLLNLGPSRNSFSYITATELLKLFRVNTINLLTGLTWRSFSLNEPCVLSWYQAVTAAHWYESHRSSHLKRKLLMCGHVLQSTSVINPSWCFCLCVSFSRQ